MNNNYNFVRIFSHGSSLMLILFDFFLNKNDDSNKSSDILNIILSCQTIYRTCNIFVLRRRIKYTEARHFDKNRLNSIIRLFYDSYVSLNNRLTKFPNLKKLTFGSHFNQSLKEGYLPSNLTQLTFGSYFTQQLKKEYLPSNLTELELGSLFNQSLKEGCMPINLTKLTLGFQFNPLTFGHKGLLP